MKKTIISIISLYQKTLSPDHGWFKDRHPHGYCRFYPSCSEYSRLAFVHNSIPKATKLSVSRVLRCNPLSKPRVDLSYTKEQTTC